MRRVFEFGGYAAAVILIAFGVGALLLGVNGRSDVQDNLAREKIEGSPDMTPEGIREGVEEAGITVSDLPECSVAGELVDSGDEARCFAEHMRVHALESTGGLVYAEMRRFLSADSPDDPAGTNEEEAALLDDEGNPSEWQAQYLGDRDGAGDRA